MDRPKAIPRPPEAGGTRRRDHGTSSEWNCSVGREIGVLIWPGARRKFGRRLTSLTRKFPWPRLWVLQVTVHSPALGTLTPHFAFYIGDLKVTDSTLGTRDAQLIGVGWLVVEKKHEPRRCGLLA